MLLTSLAFPHAHLSPNEMATEDSSSNSHSSGLGVMPSMSAECTPLKHRYDACFNKWFEDYLGLPAPPPPSSAGSARDSGVSGFFSQNGSSALRSEPSQSDRRRLRDRLDGECGAMWKEYQSCVLVSQQRAGPLTQPRSPPAPQPLLFPYPQRAVKAKDLDKLIDEAREHNPFPFPSDRKSNAPNNEPFPFPAAGKDTR